MIGTRSHIYTLIIQKTTKINKIFINYIISNDTIIFIIIIFIFLFSLSILLLLLIILYTSLLLSESVLDSISVTTVFTLLFDIGQYLVITKKFHKEFQYI